MDFGGTATYGLVSTKSTLPVTRCLLNARSIWPLCTVTESFHMFWELKEAVPLSTRIMLWLGKGRLILDFYLKDGPM